MTFPCDMVDMEMVHMDMADMATFTVNLLEKGDIYVGKISISLKGAQQNTIPCVFE